MRPLFAHGTFDLDTGGAQAPAQNDALFADALRPFMRFIYKSAWGGDVSARQDATVPPTQPLLVSAPVPGGGCERGEPHQAGALSDGTRAILPEPGSRFSDEELGARLGVPLTGAIRVSHENRCIALVDRAGGGPRGGDIAVYMGQDGRGRGDADRASNGDSPCAALENAKGYAVLDFAREGGALVLGRVAECDSLRIEKRGGRDVAVFRMRAAGGEAGGSERLNPEVERDIRSIESGTFVGKRCTIDEYIEHVKKVME